MKNRRTTKYTGAYMTVEEATRRYQWGVRRQRIKRYALCGLVVIGIVWGTLALGAGIARLVIQ